MARALAALRDAVIRYQYLAPSEGEPNRQLHAVWRIAANLYEPIRKDLVRAHIKGLLSDLEEASVKARAAIFYGDEDEQRRTREKKRMCLDKLGIACIMEWGD